MSPSGSDDFLKIDFTHNGRNGDNDAELVTLQLRFEDTTGASDPLTTAEANAIIQAARNGVNIDGSTNYVTASPCWKCFKELANAGVTRICYGEFYRDDRIFDVAAKLEIDLIHVPLPGVTLPKLPPQGPG